MDYQTALTAHKRQWLTGKHAGREDEYVFPYNNLYGDDEFIRIIVPPSQCELQEIDEERVNKYVDSITAGYDLGPSWALFGKKLKNGAIHPFWHKKFYILDGNHRIAARTKLKHTNVELIVPKMSYELYVRNNNE